MGRRFPANDNFPAIHPVLSFSLLVAGMAATITIVLTLCGAHSRRRKSPPPMKLKTRPESLKALDRSTENRKADSVSENPPKKQMIREIQSFKDATKVLADKIASDAKMAASLSARVTRSLSMARNNDRDSKNKDEKKNNNGYGIGKKSSATLEHQDSIWMKTIILGEKCKVPDHHDDQDHGVIYEGINGRKISAYHPRTASSLTISRQCSSIDQDHAMIARLEQFDSSIEYKH